MNVSAVYRRVPADIYNRYLTGDYNGLIRVAAEEGRTLDIDKSWDILHVFLTGTDEENDEPLSRAIHGMSVKIDRSDDDEEDGDDEEEKHEGFGPVEDDEHSSHGDDDYEDDFDDDFDGDDLEDKDNDASAAGMFGLGPNIVVDISTALNLLDPDELVERLRTIEFADLEIPSFDPEELEDAIVEVKMFFEQMREFYNAAAEEGDGVLISMS